MPTTNSLWGRSLVNLGPLTTTFTAPTSCSATPLPVGLADSAVPYSGAIAMETCGRAPRGGCLPSGADLDREYQSSLSASASAYLPIHFHSPGNACPSGWATVGVVVKDAAGDVASSSWAFDPRATGDLMPHTRDGVLRVVDQELWDAVVFGRALGPQETGVACCPSGFSPLPSGGCYSTAELDAYTATTACQALPWWPVSDILPTDTLRTYSTETMVLFEQTVTVVFISLPLAASVTGFNPTGTRTNSVTFSDPERIPFSDPQGGWLFNPPYVAYYTTDMVLLAETGSTGGVSDGGSDGDEGNTAGHIRGDAFGKIVMVMGAWAAAMIIGGALVIPM